MNRDEARRLAHELVAKMTVEEKASQLSYEAPAIPRLGIPAYNWWNEALHGVARAGTATMFPQAIGMAATFDRDLVKKEGGIIAHEGRAKYNMQSARGDRDIYKGLTFWSPNVNIFRDPRWGRGQETYGEDPYLTSAMGVEFVKALQGDGTYMKAAACAKHFAVHSGPEAIRHEFDAVVSDKDLRETYLPAFEALVKDAGVESVMGAYNRTNGEPCCGSKALLVDILRGEWGHEGHVVSDCWAIRDFHTRHMVTDTAPESAALAIKNGCDINCGNTYLHLMEALQEGLITEEDLTRSCERAFTARYLLGLFAEDCEYDKIPYTDCDTDESAAVALRAAEEAMVLLKNDGILPLDLSKIGSIAVIGPNADNMECLKGNYYGSSSRLTTFLEGVRKAAEGKARVFYSEGSPLLRDSIDGQSLPGQFTAEAAALAELCDVTILCLGLDDTIEGEEGAMSSVSEFGASGDKNTLELPAGQRLLVEAVKKTGKPFITVVAPGSALRLEDGNAILAAWYPGQAGGTALANLLFGAVSPSGRLPVTFYKGVDDLPEFTDYAMKNRTYRYYEGEALYPFGFGLSYTEFAYADAAYAAGCVSVTVKNVGKTDADEVAQVYVARPESEFDPRNPSLAGFARVHVPAGGEVRVSVPLDKNAFTVVDDGGNRLPYEGKCILYVGGSQPDPVSCRLTGKKPIEIEVTA